MTNLCHSKYFYKKLFVLLFLITILGCSTTHTHRTHMHRQVQKEDNRDIAALPAPFVFPKKKCKGAPAVPDNLNDRTISQYQNKLRMSLFELAKTEDDVTRQDIKCLESIGARIDARDGIGNTPLHYAIAHDNMSLVLFFLEQDPSLYNVSNRQGKTASDYIKLFNRSETYDLLMSASKNNSVQSLASEVAKLGRYDDLLHVIDEFNVDVNIPSSYAEDTGDSGITALMHVARLGAHQMVKPLIQRGADVNAQSLQGNTPLMFAISHGHPQTALALIEHSAKDGLDLNNTKGQTALILSVLHNTNNTMKDVMIGLIEGRCDTNLRDQNLDTALHHAAKLDDAHTLSLLISYNRTNVGLKNNQGDTARDIAIKENHQDVVDAFPNILEKVWQSFQRSNRKLSEQSEQSEASENSGSN